jgi:hypothetical protein
MGTRFGLFENPYILASANWSLAIYFGIFQPVLTKIQWNMFILLYLSINQGRIVGPALNYPPNFSSRLILAFIPNRTEIVGGKILQMRQPQTINFVHEILGKAFNPKLKNLSTENGFRRNFQMRQFVTFPNFNDFKTK